MSEKILTSKGEIEIRHCLGERLPILLLGRRTGSDDAAPLQSLVAREHRLIEFDASARRWARDAAVALHADLALEMLEILGIEQAAALDWTVDGEVGRELMAIFLGLVSLGIVGPGDDKPEDADPAILHIDGLEGAALANFARRAELRAERLSAAPQLWYGG